MTLVEELEHVKAEYPQAYAYMQEIRDASENAGYSEGMHDAITATLPTFDDDDNFVKA